MTLNGTVSVENDVRILGKRGWENLELDTYSAIEGAELRL